MGEREELAGDVWRRERSLSMTDRPGDSLFFQAMGWGNRRAVLRSCQGWNIAMFDSVIARRCECRCNRFD